MNGSLDKQRIVSSVNIVMHVAIIFSLTLSITLVRVERIMLTFDYLQMCTMIKECVLEVERLLHTITIKLERYVDC